MNERLNRAVERLLVDKRFIRRFRRDPERALARFDLTRDEVEAVKSGDGARLLELGLDPRFVWPRLPERTFWLSAVARLRPLSPVFVLAALAGAAAPAAAARATRESRASRVGRVQRFFAVNRAAGRFNSTLARTGRSGRAISRAANRSDSSAFVAAARRTSRARNLPPPPGGGDSN